jgi:hypothetical protein
MMYSLSPTVTNRPLGEWSKDEEEGSLVRDSLEVSREVVVVACVD